MARRSKKGDPELLRQNLIELLQAFAGTLKSGSLRTQVKQLVPAYHHMRDLGGSLMGEAGTESGRARILAYFKKFPGAVLAGGELMVIAGIDDYPRRIRELRVEHGWALLSGITAAEMRESDEESAIDIPSMKPDEYMLLHIRQDADAAHRWGLANKIRGAVPDN